MSLDPSALLTMPNTMLMLRRVVACSGNSGKKSSLCVQFECHDFPNVFDPRLGEPLVMELEEAEGPLYVG